MLKIGLTGGICCGKSTAADYLKEMGAYIFDADTEAKILIADNPTVQNELIAEFGTDIVGVNNKIDPKKMARIVFQDEDHQMRLNYVVHPYVFEEIDTTFEKVSASKKCTFFIVDGAVIFESGYDQHLDYVVLITTLMKNRMERAMARGKFSRHEILQRMDLQWSEEEKIGLADFVIHNDGTEDDLKNEIKDVFQKII